VDTNAMPTIATLALLAPALLAQSTRQGAQGPDLTRYLLVCVLLLVALGALGWGMKKLVAGAVRQRADKRSLQVMDLMPLGGKQRLAVVRCYDRTFALGLGEKEIALIAELDPVVRPASTPTTTPVEAASFSKLFARLRNGDQSSVAKDGAA
jgi:flagellar biogenesis protein FliO